MILSLNSGAFGHQDDLEDLVLSIRLADVAKVSFTGGLRRMQTRNLSYFSRSAQRTQSGIWVGIWRAVAPYGRNAIASEIAGLQDGERPGLQDRERRSGTLNGLVRHSRGAKADRAV